jgi:16S rRNA (guanine1207-N2)-methyltransferase
VIKDPKAIARAAVYGAPDRDLAEVSADSVQFSPLVPGASAIETLADGSLDTITLLAPPGSLERRYELAQALRALKPGGALTALALKDKGGSRLRKELEAFGCVVTEESRRHHRICHLQRPATLTGLEDAIAAGAPRLIEPLGLWSQPGVFSWDRVDPGSALLAQTLPNKLNGDGADLGCGVGWLAKQVLAIPKVTSLALIDIDRRAIDAARRNIDDPRADIRWVDARGDHDLTGLDFVVMNPPFHDNGIEDRGLGFAFMAAARQSLRKGGVLWMVANRHLPYEARLGELFREVTPRADKSGFKVIEAKA